MGRKMTEEEGRGGLPWSSHRVGQPGGVHPSGVVDEPINASFPGSRARARW
ncbi:hypothetical protein FHS32_002118 [Streptomyces albaduncus]|uniref:Uncharacterized protein n=1 Tax=Streptomyces griseoloalbus TaxID=67303 RepID=A0A7W8F9H2_9ACTN|nr:hypothetical protein [Streptomyces albaduncus]GGW28059.1 hypothetical protein GCM10010340_01930 [Streptomyces albaduncus]